MAIDTITPVAESSIATGDSISFKVDDTYTALTIEVETSGGYEYAYDGALGGAQTGYTVSVVASGGRHTFTVTRAAGWDLSPFNFRVVEDETGSSETTTTSYSLTTENPFPQGQKPYNGASTGTSPTLSSVIVSEDKDNTVTIPDSDPVVFSDEASTTVPLTINKTDSGTNTYAGLKVITDGDSAPGIHVGNPARGGVALSGAGLTFESEYRGYTPAYFILGAFVENTEDGKPLYLNGQSSITGDGGDVSISPGVRSSGGDITTHGELLINPTQDARVRAGNTTGEWRFEDGFTMVEQADHPIAAAATLGQLWVKNDSPNTIWFTDDAGTDFQLGVGGGSGDVAGPASALDNAIALFDGTTGKLLKDDGDISYDVTSGRFRISHASTSYLEIGQRASAPTPSANRGSLWVKSDATTTLWFTDDGGTDYQLGVGGGGATITLASDRTVGIDQTEIVIGGGYIDGSTGGTFTWEALAEQIDGGGATLLLTSEIRLYDMGPDGTPAAGVLRSSLEFPTDDALDRVSLTLTASGSPGTDADEIYNTARMYEVRAYLNSTGGHVDSLRVVNVRFVEA